MCVPKFSTLKNSVEDKDEKDFENLDFYLTLAVKSIKRFCHGSIRINLLRNDDAISYIAYRLMLIDWRYREDGGASKQTRRYRTARFAILKYIHLLSNETDYNVDKSVLEQVPDHEQYSPLKLLLKTEQSNINFDDLADQSNLREKEKACILLSYSDELNNVDIARKLNVSNSTVTYNIKSGLKKLRWAS